jgi:hypothetical protein
MGVKMPRAGGEWRRDPCRAELKHRGGNPWQHVRIPRRPHRCAAQTALIWRYRTERGCHTAAVLWCGCGAVTYPGAGGRWVGRNLRRAHPDGELPAWHRELADLDRPPDATTRRTALISATLGNEPHPQATESKAS